MNFPNMVIGTIVFNGEFKDINEDGLAILEICAKYAAFNFDAFMDKDLREAFSLDRKRLDGLINGLSMLEDGKDNRL